MKFLMSLFCGILLMSAEAAYADTIHEALIKIARRCTQGFGVAENKLEAVANTVVYFYEATHEDDIDRAGYCVKMVRFLCDELLKGNVRYMAAAYRAYTDAKKLDMHDPNSYKQFSEALSNTFANNPSAESLYEWMKKNGPKGAGEKYYKAILNTNRTTDLIAEFDFLMDIMQLKIKNVNNMRDIQYKKMLVDMRKITHGKLTMKNLFGGSDFKKMSSEQIYDAVMKSAQSCGILIADATILAEKASQIQSSTAWKMFTYMSNSEAEHTVLVAEEALSLCHAAMKDKVGGQKD